MEDMPKRECRIGLVQSRCSEDLEENTAKTISGIREAAGRGAQIICTQELFRSTYFCQREDAENFQMAEPIPGPTTLLLQEEARSLGVVIVGSLFEERAPGLFHNTAVVIDADGTLLGTYRKMHIPDDPCFFEKFYFTPGDTGFKSFPTRYGRVGVLICWDQWFPEAARLTALSGAQFLFYPTAIGYQDEDAEESNQQITAWETIQKSHAISNGVFLGSVNRVGRENSLTFWGRSFICNPFGSVIGQAENVPQIVMAKCSLPEIETVRQNWPFLRDRRVDAYQDISKLYIDNNE